MSFRRVDVSHSGLQSSLWTPPLVYRVTVNTGEAANGGKTPLTYASSPTVVSPDPKARSAILAVFLGRLLDVPGPPKAAEEAVVMKPSAPGYSRPGLNIFCAISSTRRGWRLERSA
jgi:hypothetical protein